MAEQGDRKKLIENIFGGHSDVDDSDLSANENENENEKIKNDPSTESSNLSATGLFGSESETDSDNEKLQSSNTNIKKNKVTRKIKVNQLNKEKINKRKQNLSQKKIKTNDKTDTTGDAYDESDEDLKPTEEDTNFIDNDDDLSDVLNEYNQDRQDFHNERPERADDDFEVDDNLALRNNNMNNYFDQTMELLKASRRRTKKNLTPQEIEAVVQELLYRMDKAYVEDLELVKQGKPALEKIFKKWIGPLENGELPSLSIRTQILQLTTRLPVYKDHLKRSGFGKTVMALWKHPQETVANKEVCRELIDRWSRAVFDKTTDFTKLAELEAEKILYQRKKRKTSNSTNESNNSIYKLEGVGGDKDRVRIPQPMKFDFLYRPHPKVNNNLNNTQRAGVNKIDPESKKGKLLKRMQEIARPIRKNVRAIDMSIEGRGI